MCIRRVYQSSLCKVLKWLKFLRFNHLGGFWRREGDSHQWREPAWMLDFLDSGVRFAPKHAFTYLAERVAQLHDLKLAA